MRTPLHSVGPKSMTDDEHAIAAGCRLWMGYIFGAEPIATAYFVVIKWVLAILPTLLVVSVHEMGGRL
jgi:hypothetical protein